MNIFSIIKLSIENLLSFKFRSFLTTLGIIMGIASVVLISSLGEGFQNKILSDINQFANNAISVRISRKFSRDQIKYSYYFTEEDMKMLKRIDEVEYVVPNISISGLIKSDNGNDEEYYYIDGFAKDYDKVLGFNIVSGRKFSDVDLEEGNEVVAISTAAANRLFKNENPIGKKITFNDYWGNLVLKATVIAVVKTMSDSANETFSGGNNEFIGPAKLVDRLNSNVDKRYDYIAIKVKDINKINETRETIKKFLENDRGKKDIYEISLLKDQAKQINNIFSMLKLFISLVASIAIIVGGIGVMNIMLVSVKERITEIGLRKALGAKNKDIKIQFLIETVILTLLGGIIGIIIGFLIAIIIGKFIKVTPILSLPILLTAFTVSTLTGLLFGMYPAKQASKLSPMEALRKE